MSEYYIRENSEKYENIFHQYSTSKIDSIDVILSLHPTDDSNLIFIVYDDDRLVGYIPGSNFRNSFKILMEVFMEKYDYGMDIFIAIPSNDNRFSFKLIELVSYGFINPGINLNKIPEIIMERKNENITKSFMNSIQTKNCLVVLKEFNIWQEKKSKNLPCFISVQLSKNTKEELHRMVNIYNFGHKNQDIQHEFSGVFKVSSIRHEKELPIYELSLNSDHTQTGDNDSVDGVDKCFTFHTHPRSEYKNIGVDYAWPSESDIKSIFELITDSSGILHILTGLEGFYYVSINKHWANRLDELRDMDKKKILKPYHIPYPDAKTGDNYKGIDKPETYIKHVNNKENPFQIQFRKWNDNKPVSIAVTRFVEDGAMYCKGELI